MTAVQTAVGPLLGAAAKQSSGSPVLLIFVVVAAAFYFLIYRPQQRKAKLAREQTQSFEVGDEVLTAGGIVGYIIEIDGDRVTLETSVGASFVVLRQYVIRKLEEPASADPDEGPDDPDDTEEFEDQETDGTTEESSGAEETGGEDSEAGDEHPAGRGGPQAGGGPPEGDKDSGGSDGPPTT